MRHVVVAEALADVHKQGAAGRVHLTPADSGGTVRACVRDDGVGGELWITSPAGAGTELRVEVPCGS